MFTETTALMPIFVGLIVYGTMGLIALIWFLKRPKPCRVSRDITS